MLGYFTRLWRIWCLYLLLSRINPPLKTEFFVESVSTPLFLRYCYSTFLSGGPRQVCLTTIWLWRGSSYLDLTSCLGFSWLEGRRLFIKKQTQLYLNNLLWALYWVQMIRRPDIIHEKKIIYTRYERLIRSFMKIK